VRAGPAARRLPRASSANAPRPASGVTHVRLAEIEPLQRRARRKARCQLHTVVSQPGPNGAVNIVMVMRTVYFDTNAYIDVFELRDPTLFPIVADLAWRGALRPVMSEVHLIELLASSSRSGVCDGLRRLFSVGADWLLLTALGRRELAFLYDGRRKPLVHVPPGSLMPWVEAMPYILTDQALARDEDLGVPTPESLVRELPREALVEARQSLEAELHTHRNEIREMLAYVDTRKNVFRKFVACALEMTLGATETLAETLWADPDRAPAFRIEVEIGCEYLSRPEPKWTPNDLFDYGHAGAIAYVDAFITSDGAGKKIGLLQRLKWYDDAVRKPRGVTPYGSKIFRSVRDLLTAFPAV
jgi:hypothetical protein